jgi:hypothetical protein
MTLAVADTGAGGGLEWRTVGSVRGGQVTLDQQVPGLEEGRVVFAVRK